MTRFKAGDRVKSNINAQGLRKDDEYTVVEVLTQHTPFGGFTTYVVTNQPDVYISVGNGHLVLTEA